MSINSLTNAATARRPDFAPLNTVPNGLSEIALAAAGMPSNDTKSTVAPGGATTAANGVNTAMQVLFGYIPTEVLTLYVAVVAAIRPSFISSSRGVANANAANLVMQSPSVTPVDWIVFWSFLAATPIILWVVYAAKMRGAQKTLPLAPSAWPLWEMFAATLAYTIWVLALPETPFRQFHWYSTGLAGVGVLVVSTILGLLAPLFQNRLGS